MSKHNLIALGLILGPAVLLLAGSSRIRQEQLVLDRSFAAGRAISAGIPVSLPNETHTVELIAPGSTALRWSIEDPAGEMLSGGRELSRHAGPRSFRFTPRDSGVHRLRVESAPASSSGNMRLSVTVDRAGPFARLFDS